MKKLLFLGINNRVLINSSLKLNYNIYSSSYFFTADTPKPNDKKNPYNERHFLKQIPNKSCGLFENQFTPDNIIKQSKEWIDKTDHIILNTGISPSYFKGNIKRKIIGNKNIENIENKYKFYKKTRNKYKLPLTFKLKNTNYTKNETENDKGNGNNNNNGNGNKDINMDMDESIEIVKQYNDKQFLIKDLYGSGGYSIFFLNKEGTIEHFNNINGKIKQEFILQEYIKGDNLSCSLLSSKDESKAIVASKNFNNYEMEQFNQTKTNLNPENKNIEKDFRYGGNIVPLDENEYGESILKDIYNTCEDLISDLKLIGSNGVDLILNNGELNIIEVNPRFQGTYECVEEIYKINLLKAHIDACNGELDKIKELSKAKCQCMKQIIYSNERTHFKGVNTINTKENTSIYDIPHDYVFIEKNQPFLTLISKKIT
ncbi:MAG: ATP-grasp domain-containing protein [Methanobrevibacter sp.]|jgi:predicted ATP-grasp superfamily ATP-dependent carboligase|nr:ATP-grasp domain-containing protein [Methanobrevibacter sp.]